MKTLLRGIGSLICITILASCLIGCSQEETEETTVAPVPEYEVLPDFSVECIDGSTFTLSEELKDHELVMINMFATWCPPCAREFPHMEEAWKECKDKVSIIALSVELTDTIEVLQGYADEMGLTFPIGREEGLDLQKFTEGYPTSILIDKEMRLVAKNVGVRADVSKDTFLNWFDNFDSDSFDPAKCTYTVYAVDVEPRKYVPGVVVNFCTDTMCVPVTTDENGVAVFQGLPAQYHVQIISTPDGLEAAAETEWYTNYCSQSYFILLEATK